MCMGRGMEHGHGTTDHAYVHCTHGISVPRMERTQFYAVSAEVIPIIFIAVAVQQRLFERSVATNAEHQSAGFRDRWPKAHALMLLGSIFFLLVAEVSALIALFYETDFRYTRFLVAFGLTVGAVLINAPYVVGQFQPVYDELPRWVQVATWIIGVLVLLGVATFAVLFFVEIVRYG